MQAPDNDVNAAFNALMGSNTSTIQGILMGRRMTWGEFSAMTTFSGASDQSYDFHRATRCI